MRLRLDLKKGGVGGGGGNVQIETQMTLRT